MPAASRRWRTAMADALYGPDGFFVADPAGPAGHFRTSVHASPLFAAAVLRLVRGVDEALGHPTPLDVVDVGAGRGELLRALAVLAPPDLRDRLRLCAVELAGRPADLPPEISWAETLPARVHGVLLATEWLDNVPLDVAALDETGQARYVLVDPDGAESLGPPVDDTDAQWLARWWPLSEGTRAEIGLPRDAAWSAAVAALDRGLAVCVDYGHLRPARPPAGTLAGFRAGRQVPAVPDGLGDITAHVAMDAVAAAGSAAAGGVAPALLTQRQALRGLGVRGTRPPLTLASRDPAAYVRALAAASQAAELTDPAGLGGHFWLLQPVGLPRQSVIRWVGGPVTPEITS
ncbi:MAG: SAM-dependent methyltransferase [Micromonosporaceae bacterium]